jgi:hypothetical protein
MDCTGLSPWVLDAIGFGLMALVTVPAVFLAAIVFLGADAYLSRAYGKYSNATKLYGFVAWIGALLLYAVVMNVLLQSSLAAQFICRPF